MTATIREIRAYTAPGYPPCSEFYVYLGSKLVRVCPSRGMAEEVAAGADECEECGDYPAERDGYCMGCWNEIHGQFGVGA